MEDSLVQFFKRRAKLLAELDAARAEIDAWLAVHFNANADLKDLAFLEGLLGERRDLLTQLLHLDESAIEDLIRLRGGGETLSRSVDVQVQE